MKLRNALVLTALSALSFNTVRASHIAGGEILYEYLGGGQWEITVNLFRDCDGITMPPNVTVDFNSPCGNQTLVCPLGPVAEVSQLCPEEIVNSTCNGGTLPGMEMYTYTAIITLPPCDFWTMSWSTCCRNAANDNLVAPDTQSSWFQATLNNEDYPTDNSPVFNNVPIPYVCLNQPVNYSFGVSEADGDSLGYSLISAMDVGGTPLAYVPPYSASDPITGITLDPITGLMQFTPTVQGIFTVVVLVTQYDEDGNVIGTVMRDIQFVVILCTNQAPDPTTGTITNFSGSATQTGTYGIELCETDDFCFDFTINDADVIDTLSLTSNLAIALPGSTLTYTGTNPLTGTVCWTAPVGSGGFHTFVLIAADDACPVNSFQTYVYTVNVLDRTSAGPDITICGDQVAPLDGNGGSVFTWSVMSTTPPGDPINVGVNFSCNPCEDPIAAPSVTTTYIVNSDLSGTCINSDTVTVFVVPDFTFTVTQAATTLCLGATVQYNVTVSPPGAYIYNWTPATGLSATNIANPVGSYNLPGTYDYTITMDSPDGCVQLDTSISVTVNPAFAPNFTVSQEDFFLCQGESTEFLVELDNTIPNFCGLNPAGCSSGTITQTDVGDSTLAGTGFSYPAIFGQFYTGNRNQMLFTAAELYAAGFVGGTISEIAFNVQSIPSGAVTDYHDFEIKMGCTTLNELEVGTWITGLSVVSFDTVYNITPGWNTFVFDQGFNWDGVSNLLVETCTDRYTFAGGSSWTQNSPNFYSVTGYNSVHEWHSDGGSVCTDTTGLFFIESVSPNRPNTRFTYCAGINEDQVYFEWTPTTGLSCSDCPNPTVTPTSSPAVYTIEVGDLLYGCSETETLTVEWYPPADVSFTPDPNVGVAPVSIYFNNTSGSGVGNFNWDFGDGGSSTDAFPTYEYLNPGPPPGYWYVVTLSGYDANGCFGVWVDSVQILDKPIVEIPNVFSPNGDGENDAFAFVDFRGVDDFKMKIFNRWGQMVYETSSVNSDLAIWKPAKDVSEGTYYFEFNGVGYNGENVNETGHVTLLR